MCMTLLSLYCAAQTPCVNGMAGGYPCNNVDLIHFVPLSAFGGGSVNEVWGWTDPLDGKEYALVGKSNGVAFFRIDNPTNPLYLGRLPPHNTNSFWRTLRTYQNYLFVSSEATGHGLQVFDLTRLRNVANPPALFTEDAWYNGFGRAHTLVIEEQTGMLFACGTNTFSGGLHIVNITNPLSPVIAGGYSEDGYTHEAQVVVYDGPDADYTGRTIVFCYNGNNPATLTIVDATDPQDVTTVSITPYPQSRYCHQGWLTPDKKYLLMDDELDESQGVFNLTRTLIWNVEDLDNPRFMGNHLGPTPAIDHNQIIIGNLSFQSNYTAGFRLLDTRQIADTLLTEVGYFDHFPQNDNVVFQGEWMSYPFFQSGIIPLTDIYQGLFLVRVNFLHLAENSGTVCQLDNLQIPLSVAAGFAGPITFSAEGLPPGVQAQFSAQDIGSPASATLTLSGFPESPTTFQFQVVAEGAHFRYTRPYSVTVTAPPVWYSDPDGDGWGDTNQSMLACAQPEGYASQPGDCDSSNPVVYPGAPGTGQDIDNNCDGEINGPENNFCADVNGDGVVTVADVLIVTATLGCTGSCMADLNQDGIVNVLDLLLVIADYAEICD